MSHDLHKLDQELVSALDELARTTNGARHAALERVVRLWERRAPDAVIELMREIDQAIAEVSRLAGPTIAEIARLLDAQAQLSGPTIAAFEKAMTALVFAPAREQGV